MKQNVAQCDNCYCRAENAIKTYCDNPKSPNYKTSPLPNQKACKFTDQKEIYEPTIIEKMKHNIRAYNKHISKHSLRKKTPLELLEMTHPLDRREFAIELCKEHIASTEDVVKYMKH